MGGNTPLMVAALKGNLVMVNLLVRLTNLEVVDDEGKTALMQAAENGHLDVVNALLAAGAKKDTLDHNGRTACMLAKRAGHQDVVNALLMTIAENDERKAAPEEASTEETKQPRTVIPPPATRFEDAYELSYTLIPEICGRYIRDNGRGRYLQEGGTHILARSAAMRWGVSDGKVCLLRETNPSDRPDDPRATWSALRNDRYYICPPRMVQIARSSRRSTTPIAAKADAPLAPTVLQQSTSPAQEIKPPPIPPSPPPSPDLAGQCAQLLKEAALAPARRKLMQRRDALQAQYDAADAADEDFELVAALGLQLEELGEEFAQLSLSEEAYLTLTDRHAALVQQVTDRCKELKAGKEFTPLAALAKQLSALKALDLSTVRGDNFDDPVLPQTSTRTLSEGDGFTDDPVLPQTSALTLSNDEDDNALDPVLPPTKGFEMEVEKRRA